MSQFIVPRITSKMSSTNYIFPPPFLHLIVFAASNMELVDPINVKKQLISLLIPAIFIDFLPQIWKQNTEAPAGCIGKRTFPHQWRRNSQPEAENVDQIDEEQRSSQFKGMWYTLPNHRGSSSSRAENVGQNEEEQPITESSPPEQDALCREKDISSSQASSSRGRNILFPTEGILLQWGGIAHHRGSSSRAGCPL